MGKSKDSRRKQKASADRKEIETLRAELATVKEFADNLQKELDTAKKELEAKTAAITESQGGKFSIEDRERLKGVFVQAIRMESWWRYKWISDIPEEQLTQTAPNTIPMY